MGSLEDVIVSGFTEADEEVDLVSLLFASSGSIRSMSLSSSAKGKASDGAVSLKRMMTTEDDDGMGLSDGN